jgi:hypothetical protein
MLWIGICEVLSISILGGIFGACLMALAHRQTNKFNMKLIEEYWRNDIARLDITLSGVDMRIASILSTISEHKPVSNGKTSSNNKGYKNQRHFNQRG